MIPAYIGLGSNLGDRNKNINLALECLKEDPAVKIIKISSLMETDPEDSSPQPKFLNGVVKVETEYPAPQLLKKLQEIEAMLGRKYPRPKNEPRSIDLDILLYGDLELDEENLKIPHPRILEREFVVRPLLELG